MTQIKVDDVLEQRLGGLSRSLELCDSGGQVLGRYLPENEYRQILYGSVAIPLSEEEIERRRAETGGSSLQEIWQRVGRT